MNPSQPKDKVLSLEDQLGKANVGSDLDHAASHPQANRSSSSSNDDKDNDKDNTEVSSSANNGISTSGSSTEKPKTARRKSSLVTLESKLNRIPSVEKHVTIQLDDDNKVDMDGDDNRNVDDVFQQDTLMHGSKPSTSAQQSKEQDEASKKELAKILEQFDPLESSASSVTTKGKDLGIDDIIIQDRGIAPSKLKAPLIKSKDNGAYDEKQPSSSMSPNLSNSGESSPTALGSPQNSHDVLVPLTNSSKGSLAPSSPSSKSKSSSKKKGGDLSKSKSSGKDVGGSRRSEADASQENPKATPFDFHKFLEQMRHRSALPITGYFQSFLKEFGRRPWTVNEQIKIIHDFLDFIAGKMEMCDLWKNASEQEMENLREGMEKLVMNRLFSYTFSPNTADDAERDNVLSQKIQIFRWVREEHLDIPKTAHNEAYLNYAQTELKKINSYKAPRDKVICILNCCKFIFTLIRRSEGSAKGADTFLPILIYVVIRANPPHLVSNVQYISRFRNPEKLQAEAGYYLASLMGAISFIENLEVGSLSITLEEFDKQIEQTMQELAQEKRAAEQAAQQQQQQQSRQHQQQPSGRDDNRINEKSPSRDAAPQQQQRGSSKFSFFGSSASSAAPQVNAGSRSTAALQQQEEFDEKAALKQELKRQEQEQQRQRSAGTQQTVSKGESTSSFSPWTSIVNPAAALIEKGAQTASRTIQKPMQFMEKMFLDSDDEEMAKPHPPRPGQQQEQVSPSRPPAPAREDSFGEFVCAPAGEEHQVPSPSQQQQQQQNHLYPGALGGSPMGQSQEQRARSRTVSGSASIQPQAPQPLQQQQPQQPQMTREQYQQALETLRDMFPTCESQVIDTILQANEGRVTPSIDNLLEIASTADQQQQQQQQGSLETTSSTTEEGRDASLPEEGRESLTDSGSDAAVVAGTTPRVSLDGQHSTNTSTTVGKTSELPVSGSDPGNNQERELPSSSPSSSSPPSSSSKQDPPNNDLISF
ncbi:hypothetical protein DFQ26_002557 [Actinomortierella ambigua]|nr:hypothetical protein DFQ26_002557 [Actinomortierella ambigua]